MRERVKVVVSQASKLHKLAIPTRGYIDTVSSYKDSNEFIAPYTFYREHK